MPFKQFASCEPPKPSYTGNKFCFIVRLSDKHADLKEEVVSYVERFLLPKYNRDALHYELPDDGKIQIEDCDDVALIAEFKEWMDRDETKELISYSGPISDGDLRNWNISLTDYGFDKLTERKKKEEKQKKEEEILTEKKWRKNQNRGGDSLYDSEDY